MKISDEIWRLILGLLFTVFLIGWLSYISTVVFATQDKQACLEKVSAVQENKIDYILRGIDRIEKKLDKENK